MCSFSVCCGLRYGVNESIGGLISVVYNTVFNYLKKGWFCGFMDMLWLFFV